MGTDKTKTIKAKVCQAKMDTTKTAPKFFSYLCPSVKSVVTTS